MLCSALSMTIIIIYTILVMILLLNFELKFNKKKLSKHVITHIEPTVTLFLPMADITHDHITLLKSLENQNYNNYQVIIIYEKYSVEVLPPSKKISFISASRCCNNLAVSRKLHNLLLGLQFSPTNTEYYLFIDDDIHLTANYISNFIEVLTNTPGSIVTSYRIIKNTNSLLTSILKIANNSVVPFMAFNRWKCIWGGSFGLSKELFEALNVVKMEKRVTRVSGLHIAHLIVFMILSDV